MQSSNNAKEHLENKHRIKNKDKTKDRIRNKIAFMKNKLESKYGQENLNKKLKE